MYELLGTQVPLVSTYFINIVCNAGLFGISNFLNKGRLIDYIHD